MDEFNRANLFIEKEKHFVTPKYRQKYHLMPPIGWMNDPNGLINFNGVYHLYYQFYPYKPQPGKMCWGHAESKNLLDFKNLNVALICEGENEHAFSGGAVEREGEIVAFYTLHTENGNEKSEEVYMGVSSDGSKFTNNKKVYDNETLPSNISRIDFRDPCPVKIGDKYYVFVGGKDKNTDSGVIVVLGGKTCENLEYKFCLGPYYELGDMGECPSYFRINGKDVICVSGCKVINRDNDFKNVNSSVFIVGDLDFEKGNFKVDFIKEIDKGDSFYAPQFIRGDSKPIMIGWLEMWDKPYPTKDMGHGWVGSFSIPRTIEYKDGDIFQQPIQSLNDRLCEVKISDDLKCSQITFEFSGEGELNIEGNNGKIIIGNNGYVYLDTTFANNSCGCIRRTNLKYDSCSVKLLLDISSIEVFVDNGREVISSRIYIDSNYSVKKSGKIFNLEVKGVKV